MHQHLKESKIAQLKCIQTKNYEINKLTRKI